MIALRIRPATVTTPRRGLSSPLVGREPTRERATPAADTVATVQTLRRCLSQNRSPAAIAALGRALDATDWKGLVDLATTLDSAGIVPIVLKGGVHLFEDAGALGVLGQPSEIVT